MDSTFYVENVLQKTIDSFLQAKFGDVGHRIQQGKDPKHTSKFSRKFIDL